MQVFPDTLVQPLQLLKSEFVGRRGQGQHLVGRRVGTTAVQPVVAPVVHECPSPVIVPIPPPELLTCTV